MGYFTIDEAIDFVRKGFLSQVAQNPEAKMAKGLFLRTDFGLRNHMGKRLIVIEMKHNIYKLPRIFHYLYLTIKLREIFHIFL